MSNITTNDASKAQPRCKQDMASKIKGVSVLRDPQFSKVRFSWQQIHAKYEMSCECAKIRDAFFTSLHRQ